MELSEEFLCLSAQIEEIKKIVKVVANGTAKNSHRIFSIDEASEFFGISKKRITKAVRENELKHYKLNDRDISLKQGDVERWIDEKEVILIDPIRSRDHIAEPTVRRKRERRFHPADRA